MTAGALIKQQCRNRRVWNPILMTMSNYTPLQPAVLITRFAMAGIF
jgi:hypothetical protein